MEHKELRTLINKALKLTFVPKLRTMGFTGSYPHFRRFRQDAIDILGIQFSQWGPQFYIEISTAPSDGITLSDGTHFPPKSVKYYHAGLGNRKRIGKNPFDFEQNSATTVIDQALKSLEEAENWWSTNDPIDERV